MQFANKQRFIDVLLSLSFLSGLTVFCPIVDVVWVNAGRSFLSLSDLEVRRLQEQQQRQQSSRPARADMLAIAREFLKRINVMAGVRIHAGQWICNGGAGRSGGSGGDARMSNTVNDGTAGSGSQPS